VIRAPGTVYTPAPLAAEVVRATLAPLVEGRPRAEVCALRVCDPACGEGVFLVEACRYLAEHAGSPELVARRCLLGVDRDGAALARAAAAVRGFAGAEPELVRADALRTDAGALACDAVVGNPPWVSWSGRHAVALADRDRRDYARRFETFEKGWPSLHGLFVELATRIARKRIGLLLPAQVCDLEGYGAVRALVRARGRAEACDCGERAFAGVTQPCAALYVTVGEGEAGDATPFPLRAPTDVARLHGFRRPPPEIFADIGVHTGNCAARLLRDGVAPVREGKDVFAFRLARPRRTLRTDLERRSGDYFRIAPRERYEAVPILLRQTAPRPIAALHHEPTYFRNSVLACRGVPGVPHAWVVAWLNSGVVARFHEATVREASQRAFPQVKLRHLRNLPMPDWDRPPPGLPELAGAVARDPALAPRLDALVSRWFGEGVGEYRDLRRR